jgi:5-methylcytosine-specific restriction endonuclease McrA
MSAMAAVSLSQPVLVLDAGYQPVNVVNIRRALALICKGKAVVLHEDERALLRSERLVLHRPRVIRLLAAVAHRVYRFFRVKLSKRNIMARDGWRCQYCGATDRPLTIDHVVPRSRQPHGSSMDSWENCVTACLACNVRKGNRTPSEAGMALLCRPARPRWSPTFVCRPSRGGQDLDSWRPYLAPMHGEKSGSFPSRSLSPGRSALARPAASGRQATERVKVKS